MTHDPLTHCLLCCALDRNRNRHSKVLNIRAFIFTLTVLETPPFAWCYLKSDISVTLRWVFLPRFMECRGGLAMRIPSVRPSVERVICDKMEERSVQIFILSERSFSLVSEKNGWWEATPTT